VTSKDDMMVFFQKIEHDIDTLFAAIASEFHSEIGYFSKETIFCLDLQATADGIRQEFKSALAKYHKFQQETCLIPQTSAPVVSPPSKHNQPQYTPSAPLHSLAPVNASRLQPTTTTQNQNNNSTSLPREQRLPPKVENGNGERPIRFPAEDIRYKNKTQPPPPPVVPIPAIQQQRQQQAPLVADVYQEEDEEEENECTNLDSG
jgi:hypothetical protein